jgi:hypothetical protein
VLLKGLYKFDFKTARGTGCGVMFATESGKLYGGNSGSSFIGSYSVEGEEIVSEMMMSRHNHDPAYAPMYPVDNVVMTFRSHWQDDELHSKGGTAALPGVVFESVLTPINDTDAPPAGRVGTGVMMLQDGRIRGGDAYFDYLGGYSAENGRWKGEIVNRGHTLSRVERPLFGGHEVGIGFSGTYDGEGAEGEATALAGKRSIRFKAVLKKLVEA